MALEHNAYLGRDDLGKLLRSFSLPCILSLLVSALYNIVDQIFIGNSELGYLGNAATGVVFPLLMVAMAFGWCVGDGLRGLPQPLPGQGRRPERPPLRRQRGHHDLCRMRFSE